MVEWLWSNIYAAFGAIVISVLPRLRELMGTRCTRRRALRALKPKLVIRASFALMVNLAYCHFHGPPDVFMSMIVGSGAVRFMSALTKH